MKNILFYLVFAGFVVACSPQQPTDFKVGTDETQNKSYAAGYDLGKKIPQVVNNLNDLNIDYFVQGMKDAIKKNPQVTDEELARLIQLHQSDAMAVRAKEISEASKKNIEEGKAFLEENKTKEGVKVTASGMQYKIIKQGTGKKPKATDKVEVHYEGTLIDGTIFDSSYKRGQPITFGLNSVIAGWTEGLQLLNEGGEMMLYLPSNIAYGERQASSVIGPNSTLIFKVELLRVNPK